MTVRVLHLIDSAGLYGAERVLLYLAKEQQRRGLEPIIASIGACGEGVKPLEAAAVRQGIPVVPFRLRPGPDFPGAGRLLAFARREGIDLLHSHGYKGNILCGLLPAALRRLPLVTTLHGWTATRRLSRLSLYETVDRWILRRLDAVIVVYQGMRRHPWLRDHRLRLQVVCNGIPDGGPGVESSPDPAIVEFCRGGYTVGTAGRLSPEKGFDRLIAAFAANAGDDPASRLLILGEGSERVALEAQIGRLGLTGRVLLPGFRPDATGYLPYLDLFALPSLTEGLPLVVLEAMQAGVPVLATRVGAVPELLEEGRSGFLVDGAEPASIAAALRRVRGRPQAARERAERAQGRVRAHFSSSRMADGYTAVYQQTIARTRSS